MLNHNTILLLALGQIPPIGTPPLPSPAILTICTGPFLTLTPITWGLPPRLHKLKTRGPRGAGYCSGDNSTPPTALAVLCYPSRFSHKKRPGAILKGIFVAYLTPTPFPICLDALASQNISIPGRFIRFVWTSVTDPHYLERPPLSPVGVRDPRDPRKI